MRRPYTAGVTWLRYFNWKIALTSAVFRGAMFFAMTATAGWRVALAAAMVEAAYRGTVSGFDGALVEAVSPLEPAWLGGWLAAAAIPLATTALDYALHAAHGTPNLIANMAVSLATSSLFTLFNWYAMRRGALLTGPGRASWTGDLRRIPTVAWDFLLAGPRAALRMSQRSWHPGAPASVTRSSQSVHAPVTVWD
jgi:hypothetical protein